MDYSQFKTHLDRHGNFHEKLRSELLTVLRLIRDELTSEGALTDSESFFGTDEGDVVDPASWTILPFSLELALDLRLNGMEDKITLSVEYRPVHSSRSPTRNALQEPLRQGSVTVPVPGRVSRVFYEGDLSSMSEKVRSAILERIARDYPLGDTKSYIS